MAKLLYVLKRNTVVNDLDVQSLNIISERIIPDNICGSVENTVCVKGKSAYVVINDSGVYPITDKGILCGTAILNDNWDEVGGNLPPGDYASFRINDEYFELTTNDVGSRTVWYFKDDEYFIASTSQRAIIMFIGGFSFNRKVIPWVLSTGTIGPSESWDTRIKRLPPSSNLLLSRKSWEEILNSTECAFNIADNSIDFERRLREEIQSSIGVQGKSKEGWVLPLSGGYDSRGILCHMLLGQEENESINTITWGVEAEKNRKYGDADIAKKLADATGVNHTYMLTDTSDEPIRRVLKRYLLCSEGRIDHFSGYADGMKIWSDLQASGIKGIIRGDEGFGWVPVSSEKQVRIFNGIGLCRDYDNLKHLQEVYDLEVQDLPLNLKKKQNESLEVWRDRIYHNFRIPTVLAALSDIKLSYVEQSNPLLYDNIIKVIRTMPDELREDKKLFRRIVDDVSPNIEYARLGANADLTSILSDADVVHEIKTCLMDDSSERVLPKKLREKIVNEILVESDKVKYKAKLMMLVKKHIPSGMKRIINKNRLKKEYRLGSHTLSFRAY
ncbi:asparagine synthase-related protein, partial [Vibrio splendidus]